MESVKAEDKVAMWYIILTARILNAQCWKVQEIPETKKWIFKLLHLIELDKMMRKLKEENEEAFLTSWKKIRIWEN